MRVIALLIKPQARKSMRRHSQHHQNQDMRKLTSSNLVQSMPSRTPASSYECYKGFTMRRGSDPRQEVRCLMDNNKQLTIYLPPYLPHNMAVKAVEDIRDKQYYQLDKNSSFPFFRKTSVSSSSSIHPSTRSSHVADLHRETSNQEDKGNFRTGGER